MKCGLLGHPLGHSYSPTIHSYLGTYSYELFDIPQDKLHDFLKTSDFSGINVTIPYKKSVLQYCNDLSERARILGAVNTIIRSAKGTLVGHNTDYFGFQYMLTKSNIAVADKKVLVLGSGGASNTVCCVLRELGANVIIVSRSGENHYGNLYLHRDASLIVNTTPVGMYPNTLISPIDLNQFSNLEGVLDVVYNPSRTKILLDAEQRGLTAMNGLVMLVAQAKEAAEWFTGKAINNQIIDKIHAALKLRMENTILIGMPGCGKTTIGKLLAEKLNKKFIDLDEAFKEKTGTLPGEMITNYGEDAFRKQETEIICEFGKESGLVIATGGGCVTRAENYPHLHQNGTIFLIDRDLNLLATDGRPLSQSTNLKTMYAARKPMYESFADYIVVNAGSIETVVNEIISLEESL